MKFATFITPDGTRKAGIINSREKAVPFSSLTGPEEIRKFTNVIDFIRAYGNDMPQFLVSSAEAPLESYDLGSIKLLAPLPEAPRNVICLGKNYAEHIREVSNKIKDINDLPEYPIYFSKFANPASAHEDNILLDENATTQMDYEVELAFVIGRKCRNVKKEEALNYVFGYTVLNDFSARDVQRRHVQWFKGKNLDGFCPIGPWIVHSSEIKNPMSLEISCAVNGEIRQKSNTSDMIFGIPFIIEDLSSTVTLNPGDIISTGTPAGVGMGFTPPRYLKKGDVVECFIEKIGLLRNRIV